MGVNRSQTVLVTGASSGIGRVSALYLAERGYKVVATSRSAGRLASLQAEAREKNLPLAAIELDINSDEEVTRIIAQFIKQFGPIDVLVNNAGYGLWGPVQSLSIPQLRAQFETNLFAAVRLINTVLPAMIEQRWGTIINISSVEGRLATPFNGAYASSKFALEGMSEALRTEVSPFGVRVAIVEPGLFKTQFRDNQIAGATAHDKNSPYAPFIEKYNQRHGRYDFFASDPVKVAQVIHKIIRSRRPAFRHPVGIEARAGMMGARFMPERLFQALLSRATMR